MKGLKAASQPQNILFKNSTNAPSWLRRCSKLAGIEAKPQNDKGVKGED